MYLTRPTATVKLGGIFCFLTTSSPPELSIDEASETLDVPSYFFTTSEGFGTVTLSSFSLSIYSRGIPYLSEKEPNEGGDFPLYIVARFLMLRKDKPFSFNTFLIPTSISFSVVSQ